MRALLVFLALTAQATPLAPDEEFCVVACTNAPDGARPCCFLGCLCGRGDLDACAERDAKCKRGK